jgi:hypothetical protein
MDLSLLIVIITLSMLLGYFTFRAGDKRKQTLYAIFAFLGFLFLGMMLQVQGYDKFTGVDLNGQYTFTALTAHNDLTVMMLSYVFMGTAIIFLIIIANLLFSFAANRNLLSGG